jgi:cytochrome c biogenesis protein CcdA/thiol-disulfide isomerase/thioredoxin
LEQPVLLSLALIGIVGGLITGISPCIIPVLPVIFFSGGVQAARKVRVPKPGAEPVRTRTGRPYLVVLGLVVSFSVFTLVGSFLLAILHLPQDFLVWAGTIVLILIGLGMILPKFQHILERPFSFIPQSAVGTERGGFVLGIALGTVYVPCAGPVLAAISVAGSTGEIGIGTIILTLSFALGAAVPLLVFALAGRGIAERVKSFRRHERLIRVIGGAVMITLAVGLFFDVPGAVQRLIPDYTASLQTSLATSDTVAKQLDLGGLVNSQNRDLSKCKEDAPVLESCGKAPDIEGIQQWFNTPHDKPLTIAGLKGKVILIDFWAYSCINCQRSLPHIVNWYNTYKPFGLEVIGVHSPEYAFEKVPANVRDGAARFNIDYPVALDNDLATWTNYRNRYWPADYLIDSTGTVRQVSLGEGGYATTESHIRQLLLAAHPNETLPPQTDVLDTTPLAGSTTQETYLSLGQVKNYAGPQQYRAGTNSYMFPSSLAADSFALDGSWDLSFNGITAPGGGDIRLNYHASQVRMVVGGKGTVTYAVNGMSSKQVVGGFPNSYELALTPTIEKGTLVVHIPPGVTIYSFTFG